MTITTTKIAAGVALTTLLLPAMAFAGSRGDACRAQVGLGADSKYAGASLSTMIAFGDCMANVRTTDLGAASTRLDSMQHLSSNGLTTLKQRVATTQAQVLTVKAAIDSSTSTTTARTAIHSIFTTVRVYALVLPQVWITAAGDREITIVGLMNTLQASLTTQVNALPDGTTKTNDLALLADMSAKLSAATVQANTAQSSIAGLVPDNGDAAVAASNKAALVAARANVQAARDALKVAHDDAMKIRLSMATPN